MWKWDAANCDIRALRNEVRTRALSGTCSRCWAPFPLVNHTMFNLNLRLQRKLAEQLQQEVAVNTKLFSLKKNPDQGGSGRLGRCLRRKLAEQLQQEVEVATYSRTNLCAGVTIQIASSSVSPTFCKV